MRKLMMNHHVKDATVEETQAIARQIQDRSERIRTFVAQQFQEEAQEVPTSSSQPQRYQVTPGQAVPKKKAPPPELPLQEQDIPRVPKPPKAPPPVAPQESAMPKVQGSPNPIRQDGNTRIIIDIKPLSSTEVSPYKRPPIPNLEAVPETELRIQEMRTALYEKRRILPDGTEEVIEGYQKILVQAIVGKGGTPSFKDPPKEMPPTASQEGTIEQAVAKALPTTKAATLKAPPSVAVPFQTWTSSPPPKKEKKDGLS